jgi:hypothetical protein
MVVRRVAVSCDRHAAYGFCVGRALSAIRETLSVGYPPCSASVLACAPTAFVDPAWWART